MRILPLSALVACWPVCASAIDYAELTFDFAHGTVITNQYAAQGITISASSNPTDVAIVYDSELKDINGNEIDGQDNDLERVSVGTVNPLGWDGGNLGADWNAGGVLIVQESNPPGGAGTAGTPTQFNGLDYTSNSSGVPLDPARNYQSASGYNPDDDGGGGTIVFEIDQDNFTYNYFKVNLADFEEDGENYIATLIGVNGTEREFTFSNFTLPFLTAGGDPTETDTGIINPNYDSSITSGNNHINTLPQIAIFTDPSIEALDRVEIQFAGVSGSISNIIFSEVPIPEPSSALLIALSGLAVLRRRR